MYRTESRKLLFRLSAKVIFGPLGPQVTSTEKAPFGTTRPLSLITVLTTVRDPPQQISLNCALQIVVFPAADPGLTRTWYSRFGSHGTTGGRGKFTEAWPLLVTLVASVAGVPPYPASQMLTVGEAVNDGFHWIGIVEPMGDEPGGAVTLWDAAGAGVRAITPATMTGRKVILIRHVGDGTAFTPVCARRSRSARHPSPSPGTDLDPPLV
jgi:hypothetical protein